MKLKIERRLFFGLIGFAIAVTAGCTTIHPLTLEPAGMVPLASANTSEHRGGLQLAIAKPRDLRSEPELFRQNEVVMLIPPIVFTHSYQTERDVGVWAGNAMAAALENAGYKVEHAESAKDAKAATVLEMDITSLTAAMAPAEHFISFNQPCRGSMGAEIRITRSGTKIFDRQYQGTGDVPTLCGPNNIPGAMTKALEDLIAKATPEIEVELDAQAPPTTTSLGNAR